MKLIRYLEMVGQVTGEKLLEKMGDGWDTTELFELIDKGLVSSGFGAHGTRYFRYPAWDGSKVDELLEYITKNPGLDGSKLQKALGWSREKLNRRLEELVTGGEIDKVKRGVSWLYSAGGVAKPVTKAEGVVQSKPLAQPDELGQLILEILGKGKMTTAEIAQLIPGAETPGPLREEVRLKVLSMMDSDLLNRDWWPRVEDNPARFSRKIRV